MFCISLRLEETLRLHRSAGDVRKGERQSDGRNGSKWTLDCARDTAPDLMSLGERIGVIVPPPLPAEANPS